MKRAVALVVVLAVSIGAAVLLIVERSKGAESFGTRTYVDPCSAPDDPFPQGKGIDGSLQRITLSGLNGAACELGTSREALVLSFAPKGLSGPSEREIQSGVADVTWDRPTAERALRKGFQRAIDDSEDRGSLPGWAAVILRFAVDKAPIDWLLGRTDLGPLGD